MEDEHFYGTIIDRFNTDLFSVVIRPEMTADKVYHARGYIRDGHFNGVLTIKYRDYNHSVWYRDGLPVRI